MTSNVGSHLISAVSGGREDKAAYEAMKRQVMDALRAQFRPEFLNRIDEIIVFHAAHRRAPHQDRRPARSPASSSGSTSRTSSLELTPAARTLIAREGTDPAYGARPLKRTIQRLVENPLARALLRGDFQPGDTIVGRRRPGVRDARLLDRDRSTVVAEAGRRRDARAASSDREPEPAGAGAGGRGRRPQDGPRPARHRRLPKRDPGELVN